MPISAAISTRLFTFLALFLLGKFTKGAARPFAILAIIWITDSALSPKALRAITHASMKTFGTFVPKAFARLNGAPAVTVLICIPTPTKSGSGITISLAVTVTVTGTFRVVGVAIPRPESEAVSRIGLFRTLIVIERLVAPR